MELSRRCRISIVMRALAAGMWILFSAQMALAAAGDTPSGSAGTLSSDENTRAQSIYARSCAMCHGADMAGGPAAPALKGPAFQFKWLKRTNDELHAKILTMPLGSADQISAGDHEILYKMIATVNNR